MVPVTEQIRQEVSKTLFKNLQIKNQTDTSADLYFYGDIVSDWWGAWQDEDQYPDAIKNFLTEQKDKDLNIYINSGGGSVFAGIAIYNMLKRHAQNKNVKVYVDGLAGSIASVIAFAGTDKPVIPSNAFLMIHNPWTSASGNSAELRKMADDLDQIATGIVNIYAEHLKEGVSIDTIKELMDKETWLNGQDASEYFDIEVGDAKEYAAAVTDYATIPATVQKTMDSAKRTKNTAEDAKKRAKIKKITINNFTKGELA